MLKKTITYTNYNDEEVTEDFYFNLSKAEIMEMTLNTVGGLEAMIQSIINAKDIPSIVKIFKDLILRSYGEKSADGKHFMKSPEISKAFECTEAYSILFMELSTDADAGSEFINGIIPKDLQKEFAKQLAEQNK